jgi:hypothetical protein
MKKAFLVFGVLLASGLFMAQMGLLGVGGSGAAASPAIFEQASTCNAAALTCNITLTSVNLGDFIWECQANTTSSGSAVTPTDGGDSFSTIAMVRPYTGGKLICYSTASTGQSGTVTVVCSWSSANNATSCAAGNIRGATGLDGTGIAQTNGASASTSDACPSGYTTAHNNAIAFCFTATSGVNLSFTAGGTGFSIPSNGSNLASPAIAVENTTNLSNGSNPQPSFTLGSSLTNGSIVFAVY